MPKIKINHVVSFSSEDSVHVANNILNFDANKKWKCKNSGEQNATIILQLETATVISGIDIGNEHSAFIEVLVGRSGSNENDYQVLLVMSSFMTPMESRNSTTTNRVRMFKTEDFSQPAKDEKWDRIKIVCTQPFNKNVQYGLSFITLYSLQNGDSSSNESVMKIGKFKIKDSPERDTISIGSIFMKQKENKSNDQSLTGAAAIREASNPSSLAKNGAPHINKAPLNSTAIPKQHNYDTESIQSRNRNSLLYDEDDDAPNKKIDELVNAHKAEKEAQKNSPSTSNQETNDKSKTKANSTKKNSKPSASKRKSDSPTVVPQKKKKVLKTKPFSKLLEGVVFVMSGYQNPLRANLRQKALEMGAKYKPDWGSNCTHLICAFSKTPKYYQVYGLGKIVTKSWIEECYSKRKRLPWRRYALDCNQQRESESEEEIVDEMTVLQDETEVTETPVERKFNISSDSDTEDEIEKIRNQNTTKTSQNGEPLEKNNITKNNNDKTATIDVYQADTDVEEMVSKEESFDENSPKLPDFFENKRFYIDEKVTADTQQLKRYIIAFKGKVSEDYDNAEFIISDRKDFAENLKNTNSQIVCVKPSWIWDCNDLEQLLATSSYELI